MAKLKRDWPPWWDWELRLTSHLEKRMLTRQFTEIELRRMMERATGFRRDQKEGRWVIETRFRRADWEVIVEPIDDETILEVVTAYEVTDD
jgi:hypothetical protein